MGVKGCGSQESYLNLLDPKKGKKTKSVNLATFV